jgi:hypothetical protein
MQSGYQFIRQSKRSLYSFLLQELNATQLQRRLVHARGFVSSSSVRAEREIGRQVGSTQLRVMYLATRSVSTRRLIIYEALIAKGSMRRLSASSKAVR